MVHQDGTVVSNHPEERVRAVQWHLIEAYSTLDLLSRPKQATEARIRDLFGKHGSITQVAFPSPFCSPLRLDLPFFRSSCFQSETSVTLVTKQSKLPRRLSHSIMTLTWTRPNSRHAAVSSPHVAVSSPAFATQVSLALRVGDKALPRPWSRKSQGSSAFEDNQVHARPRHSLNTRLSYSCCGLASPA